MTSRFAIDKNITINDLRFHYRDWNGHGWPVLLLHGLASTSHIWDLVAPLLTEESRVIALDMRGHGQSDKPDAEYSYDAIASDILGILEELKFERPVVVGHSWGASVGMWMAAKHGEQVSGLVMIDGGLGDLKARMTWEQALEQLRPPDTDGMPAEMFRRMIVERTPEGMLTPEVEAAIMANFEIDANDKLQRRLPVEYHLRILRSMWETPASSLMPDVACAVLAILARWQGRDDPERLQAKQAGAERARELLADGEVVFWDETIHDVPLQRPQKLAEAINTFVSEEI